MSTEKVKTTFGKVVTSDRKVKTTSERIESAKRKNKTKVANIVAHRNTKASTCRFPAKANLKPKKRQELAFSPSHLENLEQLDTKTKTPAKKIKIPTAPSSLNER